MDIAKDETRYVIVVATARSGSSLLVNLLNNHPDIDAKYREPLNRETLIQEGIEGSSKEEKLNHLINFVTNNKAPVCGFKILVEQLLTENIDITEVVGLLPNCGVIILRRKNVLEMYASLKIAMDNGVWYSADKSNNVSITIDEGDFEKYVQQQITAWNVILNKIPPIVPKLYVSFEEMVSNKCKVVTDIYKFVKVHNYEHLYIHSVRQNPLSIEQKIKNYDQIKENVDMILQKYEMSLQK